MKQTFILAFTFFLYNILSINAQNVCGSVLDLNALQTHNPSLYQEYLNQNQAIQNAINSPESLLMHETVIIPVVVHILHNGSSVGSGLNLSMAQIQSQIDVLNEDFRRLNADNTNTPPTFANVAADVNVEFRLACIDPNGNPTNGVTRTQTSVAIFRLETNQDSTLDELKTRIKFTSQGGADAWDTNSYLNIWVCRLSDDNLLLALGYAQSPFQFVSSPNTDGIVVNSTSFGRTGYVISPFHKGRIATHEVGHWLGLRHIWGDAYCGNDGVDDTPVQENANLGCPTFPKSSCSNGGNGDMFMNYMDYSNNTCMNLFTLGQRDRMRATLFQGARQNSDYMLFRAVLPSAASVRFLYGNDFNDLKSFTVGDGGILQVNGVGMSRFNNGVTLNGNPVTVQPNCGEMVNLNVDNGGQFVIGEGQRIGTVKTGNGNSITINAGATLRISNSSQLIIESGSRLIINAGANINLVELQSKITIKSGGELIINGTNGTNPNFNFTGNGYFNFEAGNILTLNNDWILRGSGKTSRLINIGHNAKLDINGGRKLTIEDALIRKEAAISNQDVLRFNNGSTFTARNVTFDDQSPGGGALAFIAVDEPVDLDNSPTDMDYSFRNCAFNRSEVAVFLGGDAGGIFDFRNLNVEFINTNFNNCRTAYYAQHGWETTFEGCTILGGGIHLQRTYWLQMRRTVMRGTRAATGDNSTVGIKIKNSCHNWVTDDCLISDYGTGIDGFTDVLATDINGNIRLDKATIQLCETAVNLRGGANIGLLYMDCARILQNNHGIKGWDLLLMAHSRNGTANIFTRPANNPNSTFFETVFLERQETDISLFGTYWNNQNPVPSNISPTRETVNNFWRFYQRNPQTGRDWPWSGNIFTDPVIFTNGTGFANCGGILPGVRGDAPVNTASAVVVVNGLPRDLRIQETAAMEELEQGNLQGAIELFSPVAAVNDATRNPANSAVRYFVDVARVMSRGESEISMRSNKNHWIPESLVEMPKEINNGQLVLSPNPANNTVNMTIKGGNYTLNVSNTIGQTIFTQNTEGSLSVDVSTWKNGIYLFEVTDKATNKQQRSKIVVQH